MSFADAATLPVALATMHNAVVTNGALQAGQTVLIQGASSGVGLMAMQIAKLKGAKLVIGSSTDAMRRGRLKEFGADLAVDSSDPAWVDQVLKATDGEGVDLIVDQVSGKVASQNLKATKIKGRIVNVGRLGGTHADFNFDLHAARRINYIGVTFRTRSVEEVREIFNEVRKDIWPRGGKPKTATADRQSLSVRRNRQGVRAHGSQQAPRQDRGDVLQWPSSSVLPSENLSPYFVMAGHDDPMLASRLTATACSINLVQDVIRAGHAHAEPPLPPVRDRIRRIELASASWASIAWWSASPAAAGDNPPGSISCSPPGTSRHRRAARSR